MLPDQQFAGQFWVYNRTTGEAPVSEAGPRPGAWQTTAYMPGLRENRFAVVCNHTATIGVRHLIDSLRATGLTPQRIFTPEHGFRGQAAAGEFIGSKRDEDRDLDIVSLYGNRKKPRAEDLADVDLVLFDIQDVGVRFYTYLSTLHYVMEACAEQGVPLIVLDRPNPNGHYIDGPVLDTAWRSFVGMHPVPVVYGMTIGEYARMINGEGWLAGGLTCDLSVIPCENYRRDTPYQLPDRPSPNLPNMRSVYLYPSLCFFEGTPLSLGRGTDFPFQLIGHSSLTTGDTRFMPVERPEAPDPPERNKMCRGWDLTQLSPRQVYQSGAIDLSWLLLAYASFPDPSKFFLPSGFFDKLAGSDQLRRQIVQGMSTEEIRASWSEDLEAFRQYRVNYLLYPDK